MNKCEEYSFSSFAFKFSKDLKIGDSYSCKSLGVKSFVFHFLSPTMYNPTTFCPCNRIIFEMGGKLTGKMISPEHVPDITIPSHLPEWAGLENEKYAHDILSKIQKPNYARTLLLEKLCQ
tara:strand:+ start:5994 stop:6353 length:360 start_codon:yes stop_codon:yes gene_type:complete